MSLSIVQSIRAKYPTPLGTRHGEFLLEVAKATSKGLLRKDWGTFVRLPDGVGVAQDILMDPSGRIYDILRDGEGAAEPTWHEGDAVDPTRYYRVDVAPEVPPQEKPSAPVVCGVDTSALEEALFVANAKLDDIDQRINNMDAQGQLDASQMFNDTEEIKEAIAEMRKELADLTSRFDNFVNLFALGSFVGKIFGATVRFRYELPNKQ